MKISLISKNIGLNLIGTLYSSIISFLFVPIYITNFGSEAYGLIAVFATIQSILAVLDGGLSTTLNREFARLSSFGDSEQQLKDTLRSIEILYFFIAILITIIALFITPYLSSNWVHSKFLSLNTIKLSFYILSTSLLFQFPLGLYSGGLMGLQKIKHINLLRILFASLKNFGALFLISNYSKDILVFFTWILLISAIQIFLYRYLLIRNIKKSEAKAKFNVSIILRLRKFTLGLSAITFISIFFSQSDKIILSKSLSLGDFGYYSIASTIGLLIFQIIGPITQTYFPKYSELIVKNKINDLNYFFHHGSQLMSLFIIPATLFLFFFSKEFVFIWTNNLELVKYTSEMVSIFAIGSAFNGLSNIHYQLFLAHGWVKSILVQNIIFLIIIIPLLFLLTKQFGAIGGAYSWLVINFCTFIVSPIIFHGKYLKDQYFKWLCFDILKPLVIILIQILLIKFYLLPFFHLQNKFSLILFFFISGLLVLLISSLSFNKLKFSSYFAS
jgi:O-antigen/teichoic acid export membrane protein